MNWKFSIFPYGAVDYKAAQEDLNRKAEAGWALMGVHFGWIARFRRSEREDLHYRVDLLWLGERLDEGGYLRLCANAGWERVAQVRGMTVFTVRTVCHMGALPAETNVGRDVFWKKVMGPCLTEPLLRLLALIAFVLGLWLIVWGRTGQGRPMSELICALPTPFFILAIGLLGTELWVNPLYAMCRWRSWQRNSCKSKKLKPKTLLWARLHGTLNLLGGWMLLICCALMLLELIIFPLSGYSGADIITHRPEMRKKPLVMAEEMGLNPNTVYYLSEEPIWSVQVQGERYVERARSDGHYQEICCDRYHCITEGVAKWLTQVLRQENQQGSSRSYGALELASVQLGFDESWSTREGAFLLLRQGKDIVLVGVDYMDAPEPDLTQPGIQKKLIERLKLEPTR